MSTLALGYLMERLRRCEPSKGVIFDFCGAKPTTLAGSKGDHGALALENIARWNERLTDQVFRIQVDVLGELQDIRKANEATKSSVDDVKDILGRE